MHHGFRFASLALALFILASTASAEGNWPSFRGAVMVRRLSVPPLFVANAINQGNLLQGAEMNPPSNFMIVLPSKQNEIRNTTFSSDDKSVVWKNAAA